MNKLYSPFLLILVFMALPVQAHDTVVNYNQVSMDASATEEVANDTMIVSLYAQEEGARASVLSDRVNKKINHALEKIKKYSTIKVETESYTTNPVYNKSKIVSWRVRQSISLKSKDIALLSELLGDLQQQLNLSNIAFDVSREKREAKTKQLIDKAIAAFNQRARQIAEQMQFNGYKLVNMNVSTSGSNPRYKHRVMSARMADAEMSSVAAPEVASGEASLNVRISGTIELE